MQDLDPPLYSSYHLSFTSSLPRSLLEELASLILASDPTGSTGQLVASVHDQFLDFVVPSSNLFSLLARRETKHEANGVKKGPAPKVEVEGRTSYVVLNDPKAGEVDIEAEVDRIAKGLLSVIITMGGFKSLNCDLTSPGTVPIIRCPRGNAAEMVSRQLEKRLRDHLASTTSRGRDLDSVLQRPRER